MASRIDVDRIRKDFPILGRTVRDGKKLVYLDSGATSQKPTSVLDAEREFYEQHNAAVHRGAHQLAEEATDAYESARTRIAAFIGAEPGEIVFTKNATESLNLVAYAYLNASTKAAFGQPLPEGSERFVLRPGDEIVVTEMEHHANLVPWQELAAKTGTTLRWIPITDEGRLDLSAIGTIINERTRVVAVVHQSNILGTVNPIEQIGALAAEVGATFVVDACQSIPHMPFDVLDSTADLVAFSGHKMLGPTGIGVLWGSAEILDAMPPFITGGSMIERVEMEATTFAAPPQRFEAGTPVVAQAVALAAAIDYLNDIGMENVAAHEHELTRYALEKLQEIDGVRIIGPRDNIARGGAISFVIDGIHAHDAGQVLDDEGVAVRVGHHCAAPVCRHYGIAATMRASFYIYNDVSDIDALAAAVRRAQEYFGTVK